MIYVDTNVFLAPVTYPETHPDARAAKRFLVKIAGGAVEAATSTLTWDEAVWAVRRVLGRPAAIEQGRRLLEFPNVKFLPITEAVVAHAQRLFEEEIARPRDAIHAASALDAGISEIASFDSDFDRVPGLKRKRPS